MVPVKVTYPSGGNRVEGTLIATSGASNAWGGTGRTGGHDLDGDNVGTILTADNTYVTVDMNGVTPAPGEYERLSF